MKSISKLRMNTKVVLGLTSVALLVPVVAIEKPAGEDDLKPKKDSVAVDEGLKKPKQAVQKIAMLGVGGMAASETLSLHLGLKEGSGLTIYHVVPGSAAEKAGLKEHDILTEVDGVKIGQQDDLRHVVRGKKPGDEVEVKYVSRGQLQIKKLVLGERKLVPGGAAPLPGIRPDWLRKNLGAEIPEMDIQPLDQEMRKRMKQMQQRMRQRGMNLDLGELMKEGAQGGFKFAGSTSVTFMDNEGSITMKTIDGNKEVLIKDKAGKIVFEGPYQTEQDKAAVPEELRERVERLQMRFGGKGMNLRAVPPAPPINP